MKIISSSSVGSAYAMILLAIGLSLLFSTQAYDKLDCELDPKLKTEIQSYQVVIDQIVEAVVNGPYNGQLYNDLVDYVDTFGPRISGSDVLEAAIDNLIDRQKSANLTVSTQQVLVPKWERGEESAEIISPRKQKLNVLGLGNSAGTPKRGIIAEVLIVKDFDELSARKNEVKGKIVLFNAEFTTYANTSKFRSRGPNLASTLGAAAVLVRSITPFSINSPHTGLTIFERDDLRIPAAGISLEHANLIARLTAKGVKVEINLKMEAKTYPSIFSRNVIGDIIGTTSPHEYVTISGHIDSWDVGQGAVDDAGGAFLAWHSLALINKLGLPTPKRTLRSIMWTGEEFGLIGAQAYKAERQKELQNWIAAFESDNGVFQAQGITFSGNDKASCIMQEITSMLGTVNGTILYRKANVGSDIDTFLDLGVPVGGPYLIPNDYFWYHHSDGDWVDVLKTEDLDQNLAIFASTIYILADLNEPLPKTVIKEKITPKDQPVGAFQSGSVLVTSLLSFVFLSTFITFFNHM